MSGSSGAIVDNVKLLRSCTFDRSNRALQVTKWSFDQDRVLNMREIAKMRWSGMQEKVRQREGGLSKEDPKSFLQKKLLGVRDLR